MITATFAAATATDPTANPATNASSTRTTCNSRASTATHTSIVSCAQSRAEAEDRAGSATIVLIQQLID